jgi:hypothetical protein
MREVTAGRTLVKSPPELWAVCSDANSLAQHLEAFGEIRITRLEPETTVAWEGERASGTVRIEPSGWGTKVTVTAAQTESVAAPELTATAPGPEDPALVVLDSDAHALQPEPPTHAPEPEPVTPEPKSEPVHRRGFFARLFGGGHGPVSQPVAPASPIAEPAVPEPAVVTAQDPEVSTEPTAIVDEQGPVDAAAALEAALDSLGQAHKRPFSR